MIFARWGAMALFAMTGMLLGGDAAAAGSSNLDVRITGTVVATALCTFSGSDPIKVEFGDVYINEIIGETYKQPVPYQVTCKGDPDGKTLQMQIAGSAASFDGKQLKTDASGLGIKLLKGNVVTVAGCCGMRRRELNACPGQQQRQRQAPSAAADRKSVV